MPEETQDVQETASADAAPAENFESPIQEMVDSVLAAARDADICLKEGNKSAGRRARGMLGDVKKKTTPLRKIILDRMKGKTKEEAIASYKELVEAMTSKKKE